MSRTAPDFSLPNLGPGPAPFSLAALPADVALAVLFLQREPVIIADRREEPPEIAFVHRGRSTFDRPSIDDLLAELDVLRDDG